MSWQGSAMCVHRMPLGPPRCSTPLFSAHDGCCHVSSATGEPLRDCWIVATLAPQDDLGAPRIDERTAEAVEFGPKVVAPKDGGAPLGRGVEDAVLVVVIGDEDVDARATTARQVGIGIARAALRIGAPVLDVVDAHVEVADG